MKFEENKSVQTFGETVGFVAAYAIFTIVLFFILVLTKRALPWYYVAGITACVACIGYLLERWLR